MYACLNPNSIACCSKNGKGGKKRELLSLIGYLHHAAKAVRQGRSFLRWFINLSMAVKPLDGYIRLNLAARSDIRWWALYAANWNGSSMMVQFDKCHPMRFVTSDASGSWGCGAFTEQFWFQLKWPSDMAIRHDSAAIWGLAWTGQSVRFQSDNAAVVALINNGTSKDDVLMHLMHCLVLLRPSLTS